jgi:hypothetical protein
MFSHPSSWKSGISPVIQIPRKQLNSLQPYSSLAGDSRTSFAKITCQVRTRDRELGNLIGGARILLPVQNWSMVWYQTLSPSFFRQRVWPAIMIMMRLLLWRQGARYYVIVKARHSRALCNCLGESKEWCNHHKTNAFFKSMVRVIFCPYS